MFLRLLILTAAAHQSLAFVVKADVCQINLNGLNPQPIVDLNGEWLYPEPGNKVISIAAGETIEIGCSGDNISAGGASGVVSVEATCISDQTFNVNNETLTFNEISCSKNPYHTARYTNQTCELNGKEVEIGFLLENIFVVQIKLCFDDVVQNTLYSYYNLTASIGAHESDVARPSFVQDDFYNVGSTNVNALYTQVTQRETINSLLGLPLTNEKYIQNNTDFYLARGHLTAKADFVYANQQRATFHYINVAPQWQTFNGANWMFIEANVRDYAELNSLDLVVYSGTHGVTTLPHEDTGKEVELFLYVTENSTGIPVPDLYWKVVYNPATKQGVALVGVNNPYKSDYSKSIVCTDVSSNITWVDWSLSDAIMGVIYACEVDDLKKTVKQIPNLQVTGLLT